MQRRIKGVLWVLQYWMATVLGARNWSGKFLCACYRSLTGTAYGTAPGPAHSLNTALIGC